jgi:hypothetical protein
MIDLSWFLIYFEGILSKQFENEFLDKKKLSPDFPAIVVTRI